MFPHKEKITKFFCFCFYSKKRIFSADSAQQGKKDETFPTFVEHFHSKKSDALICNCVELFYLCALGFLPNSFRYVIDKLLVAGVMKNKLRALRGVYFS